VSRPSEFYLAQVNVALAAARFDSPAMAGMVSRIWWIPGARLPTVEESRQRLALLARRGPTREAFSFAKPLPPPVDVTSISDARQA